MKIINFDERFAQYTSDWMARNAARFGGNLDRMEAEMPEVYLTWLNTSADWLQGQAPGTYFAQYTDPAALAGWLLAYFEARVPVPDQLLERLVDLGADAEDALVDILRDEAHPMEARLTAVSLLSELESAKPMALYVDWVARRAARDDLAEMAAEALAAMGRQVVGPVLARVEGATEAGRETFLDILCNFPGEEAILTLALSMFEAHPRRRALFASLLGKLGDARAIGPLQEAMADEGLNYLDYIELRNALEAVGGEAPAERPFDGDPYYESLRGIE